MSAVRGARPADAPALADLSTQLGYPADAPAIERRLRSLLGSPDDVVLVAVDADDRPIAWIHLTVLRLLESDDRVEIGGLVVDEAHRSRGVGAELLAAGERWARDHRIEVVVVRSRESREGAHRFYRDHGYVEIKRQLVFEKRLT